MCSRLVVATESPFTTRFSAHESSACHAQGRLLIADIEGPWNLELVQHYHVEMQPSIERLVEDGP